MRPPDLRRFKALTFDCYGTLIDWDRGITEWVVAWARRQELEVRPEDFIERFAEQETLVQQAHPTAPYPEILATVGRRIAETLDLPWTDEDGAAFGAGVGTWPPFPDSPAALSTLAGRYRLVVVSNVDRASFARSARSLGVSFDAVVTAQDVGAYKPDPHMFAAAGSVVASMGIGCEEILHVAQSLYHDIIPASGLGLASVWVNRTGNRVGEGASHTPEGVSVEPDLEVASLEELAEHVRAAWA